MNCRFLWYDVSSKQYHIMIRNRNDVKKRLISFNENVEKTAMEKMMAKAIMIQGTMSNAGKSLIAAGLCRVFHQDGYRVAPFKSQNMALNSYITEDGLEMGRAQVVQAEAAGIKPDVRMNPILLKPTTDMGSQVIVKGTPIGSMSARDYYKKKKEFLPVVKEIYDDLAKDYDIIVIEGAGSPAEINLREDDLVNMGMAKIADAPVLLVGDIDRGGVFAQLYGTIALLEEDEQERIKGVLINKFRGDEKILAPGLELLYDRIKKPVLGVLPYLDVHLEDEDSLAADLMQHEIRSGIDIAVIRLPRISNFTDFQVFSMERDVNVRYVTGVRELGHPDLIILPGTKSTMADLKWLRECGLEARIKRLVSDGTPLFGICGGFQMMGISLDDPKHTESADREHMDGMGLLACRTSFSAEKKRTQEMGYASGYLFGSVPDTLSAAEVEGYEIHMGRTEGDGTVLIYREGMIAGTYLHGIFDHEDFRRALLQELAARKGISLDDAGMTYEEYKEMQMNHLADEIRAHLDLDAIYQMMNIL